MSVTLEKRRKVAELENFERRILQEKRRLLRELESLERPFRNTRAMGWIKDFSSDVAGAWRAVQGAASIRAPVWFYVVAGAILLGGGGFVAHLASRGAPRADGATLRQVETPTTPVRIEQPAPASVTEAAQAADVAPSSALSAPAGLNCASDAADARLQGAESSGFWRPRPRRSPCPSRWRRPKKPTFPPPRQRSARRRFRRSARRCRTPPSTTRRQLMRPRRRSRTTRRQRRGPRRAKASARTSPRTKAAAQNASSRSMDGFSSSAAACSASPGAQR